MSPRTCPNHPDRVLGPRNRLGVCRECASDVMREQRRKPLRRCACGREVPRANRSGQCGICREAAKRGLATELGAHTLEVQGATGLLTQVVGERVRTLADLIRVCEIDTTEWDVERYVCNKWDTGSVNPKTGQAQVTELYQVKVWLKRRQLQRAVEQEIADLKLSAQESLVPAWPAALEGDRGPYLLELSLYDLHVGKLAWAPETMHEHYDTHLAVTVFRAALEALIARTQSYPLAKILFVIGNDLLNIDSTTNATAAGTPQDVDSRFPKTFLTVRRLMTDAVLRLRQLAPVEVLVVPGNHDKRATWHLGDSLECFFHSCPDVTIRNEPSPRKYLQFGKVMLMFAHGDRGKHLDYPAVMAAEQREMWGSSLFREAHVGHWHQTRVQEVHGTRVRVIPALCPPDAWHSEQTHVGNHRVAEAYVWHPDEGLVGTAMYTVTESNKEAA